MRNCKEGGSGAHSLSWPNQKEKKFRSDVWRIETEERPHLPSVLQRPSEDHELQRYAYADHDQTKPCPANRKVPNWTFWRIRCHLDAPKIPPTSSGLSVISRRSDAKESLWGCKSPHLKLLNLLSSHSLYLSFLPPLLTYCVTIYPK